MPYNVYFVTLKTSVPVIHHYPLRVLVAAFRIRIPVPKEKSRSRSLEAVSQPSIQRPHGNILQLKRIMPKRRK